MAQDEPSDGQADEVEEKRRTPVGHGQGEGEHDDHGVFPFPL